MSTSASTSDTAVMPGMHDIGIIKNGLCVFERGKICYKMVYFISLSAHDVKTTSFGRCSDVNSNVVLTSCSG